MATKWWVLWHPPGAARTPAAGRAETEGGRGSPELPPKPFELVMQLLDELRPGEVVCCTQQGSTRAATWGELLSTHTRAMGGRGAVLDGLTRDSWGVIDIRFPVFARGLTPADSKGRVDVFAVRVPLEMGVVLVHAGDLRV